MSASVKDLGSTPLHLHTLDSLLTELAAGRSISFEHTSQTGEVLQLGEATRKILAWYRTNRDRWAANCRKEDVESIAESIEKPLKPVANVSAPRSFDASRRLHLRRLRAFRFGGMHRFDGDAADPIFEHDFAQPLTLIEGKNGSGKTSLLNAITWCLTGRVFRPIGEPRVGSEPRPR